MRFTWEAQMEMSVGQVAKRAGINVSAPFYEQTGLIYSWRNQGNQRRYHRSIRRIAVIKAAQEVGLSLDDILITSTYSQNIVLLVESNGIKWRQAGKNFLPIKSDKWKH